MIQGFPKPWDMKMAITTRPRIAMIKNNTVKEKRNPERKEIKEMFLD